MLPPRGRSSCYLPPAANGDYTPDCFDHAKRPRALQKPVRRTEPARNRKAKNEPGASGFENITHEHGGDSEEPETRQRHVVRSSLRQGMPCEGDSRAGRSWAVTVRSRPRHQFERLP